MLYQCEGEQPLDSLQKWKCFFSPMLGTVQFSSLAGGGCVAGPGGGLKEQNNCKRIKIEKQITLADELLEADPWGRKAQQTPPIPGSKLRDVT